MPPEQTLHKGRRGLEKNFSFIAGLKFVSTLIRSCNPCYQSLAFLEKFPNTHFRERICLELDVKNVVNRDTSEEQLLHLGSGTQL